MPHDRGQRFLLFLVIGTAVLLCAVIAPIVSALLTAIVLAVVLWPLHVRLSGQHGRRRRMSAVVLTWAMVVLLAAPAVSLSAFMMDEIGEAVKYISETMRKGGVAGFFERVPNPTRRALLDVVREAEKLGVKAELAGGSEQAASIFGGVVSATGALLFQAAMMFIALFFLLLQGEQALRWVERASPLRLEQTRDLLVELKHVSSAVALSALATAFSQAVTALIGYLIVGVPYTSFFTLLTFVVAFVPAIGGASVCLVCALLTFLAGRTSAALFLAAWALLAVALVDNVVKPVVVKHGVAMPGAVVFFALIGGFAAFGAVGLLVGPLAGALFVALLRMHRRSGARRARASNAAGRL